MSETCIIQAGRQIVHAEDSIFCVGDDQVNAFRRTVGNEIYRATCVDGRVAVRLFFALHAR